MSRVAVVVCTRNRSASLRETLASLGRCRVPPEVTAELVVVDNGSTDDSPALGEFEPLLGAGALGFHEETLWAARLRAAGFRLGVAAPEASVEHHFERSRLTRATLLATAEKLARSSAWLDYHWGQDDPNVPAPKRWRARWMLFLLRALTPQRRWQPHAPAWELDRLHNLTFLETLHGFAGQPRKFHPPAQAERQS